MKKLISLILLISSLIMLASCSGSDDGIPDGMQLVRGGDDVGYYMYAPEEWTVANYGEISSAYASNVDTSSVSFVEVEMPQASVDEYFEESLKEYPEEPTVIFPKEKEDNEIIFGNADNAKKYVFEHEYSGHKFRTMQIFTEYKGRFGIFTFNSVLENISSSETYQYDYYKDKIDSVIANFKFVDKASSDGTANEVTKDEDGYILVSDKKVAKYALYLPEEFSVEHSSGMTVASLEDGSSITVSRASTTGIPVNEYWETREAELSSIVSDLKVISKDEITTLGNSKQAVAYKYTFIYNGTTYQVYQVLAITTFNGFVFTYTAKEENFDKHFDTTIKEICKRIEF